MKNAKNLLERISDLIYVKNEGLNPPPSLSITIVLLLLLLLLLLFKIDNEE